MLRVLANKTHQLIYSEKLFAFLVRELPLPASPVLSAWITVMRPGAVAAMFCHEVTSMRTKACGGVWSRAGVPLGVAE